MIPENLRSASSSAGTFVDKNGISFVYNSRGFRAPEFDTIDLNADLVLAMGDSHTEGAGNKVEDIWSSHLQRITDNTVINLGQGGCSTDCVARLTPFALDYFKPKAVCLLAPDTSRFEYFKDDKWYQSRPTDPDRIYHMHYATDEWLQNNWNQQVQSIQHECKIRHVAFCMLTLYDLIPVIDHADRWPRARNHSHYDTEWHRLVAEIFRYRLYQICQ